MALALEAGNAKAVNMVLMGVLASRMDLPEDVWQAALTKQVPAKSSNSTAAPLPRAGAEGGLTMAVRQLSVFLENRTGTLCEVTQALSDNGIDVRAITLADTVEFGILRLIVSDPVKAEEVLRAHHFTVSITEVLCVRVDDVPGGLNAVVQAAAEGRHLAGIPLRLHLQVRGRQASSSTSRTARAPRKCCAKTASASSARRTER